MKKLLTFITLRSAAVSAHRKRQFVLTALLLVTALCVKVFGPAILIGIPYAAQVLAVLTYTLAINITINALRIFIASGHRHRRNISNEEQDNFTVGLNAVVNAVTVLSAIVFVFIVFNIEVRSFLSSIALFAVALTIILQDFIKNFLFGFAIMFSADYEIGDYIQVGKLSKGVILNITFSNVQLKTESGDILFVPNTVVCNSEIVNFSKLKPKRINIDFCVLRTHVRSVDAFEKALLKNLEEMYPATFELEKCCVHVRESNKDEIVFNLEASTKKASLKLKEQVAHTVQKFAVEYGQ